MKLSVVDPVGAAFQRTKLVLFDPFDLGKWFVLGFCAFLAYLGRGGGNNFQFPNGTGWRGGGGGGAPPDMQAAVDWVKANLGAIISVAVIAMLLIAAFAALVLWVRSRGKFMLIDALVTNRPAVVEPWKAFREAGNSLMGFSLVLFIGGYVLSLLILAIGTAIAWSDLMAWRFGEAAIGAIVVTIILFVLMGIAYFVVGVLLEDFVVPVMYLHREPVMSSWRIVRTELLAGHGGVIVLYFLMRIAVGLCIQVLMTIGCAVTCCLAALPYLGTVILLPLFVFMRCYSLCFIEQYGAGWTFFLADVATRCRRCSYDLRGLTGATVCPECGTEVEGKS